KDDTTQQSSKIMHSGHYYTHILSMDAVIYNNQHLPLSSTLSSPPTPIERPPTPPASATPSPTTATHHSHSHNPFHRPVTPAISNNTSNRGSDVSTSMLSFSSIQSWSQPFRHSSTATPTPTSNSHTGSFVSGILRRRPGNLSTKSKGSMRSEVGDGNASSSDVVVSFSRRRGSIVDSVFGWGHLNSNATMNEKRGDGEAARRIERVIDTSSLASPPIQAQAQATSSSFTGPVLNVARKDTSKWNLFGGRGFGSIGSTYGRRMFRWRSSKGSKRRSFHNEAGDGEGDDDDDHDGIDTTSHRLDSIQEVVDLYDHDGAPTDTQTPTGTEFTLEEILWMNRERRDTPLPEGFSSFFEEDDVSVYERRRSNNYPYRFYPPAPVVSSGVGDVSLDNTITSTTAVNLESNGTLGNVLDPDMTGNSGSASGTRITSCITNNTVDRIQRFSEDFYDAGLDTDDECGEFGTAGGGVDGAARSTISRSGLGGFEATDASADPATLSNPTLTKIAFHERFRRPSTSTTASNSEQQQPLINQLQLQVHIPQLPQSLRKRHPIPFPTSREPSVIIHGSIDLESVLERENPGSGIGTGSRSGAETSGSGSRRTSQSQSVSLTNRLRSLSRTRSVGKSGSLSIKSGNRSRPASVVKNDVGVIEQESLKSRPPSPEPPSPFVDTPER
ncbi:hypothetical protein HDU76_009443, partial [Blyttiomyces sp. JEL0837]